LPPKHVFYKYWIVEALASAFSITLFMAIFVVLKLYDNDEYGAPTSEARDSVERPYIFPILSILSAVMRASMLLPVATAISQLKWSWFRSHRRLLDIERFDEASRGITGSLRLLWTVRFKYVVIFRVNTSPNKCLLY
jgi:hypothetical protein